MLPILLIYAALAHQQKNLCAEVGLGRIRPQAD